MLIDKYIQIVGLELLQLTEIIERLFIFEEIVQNVKDKGIQTHNSVLQV